MAKKQRTRFPTKPIARFEAGGATDERGQPYNPIQVQGFSPSPNQVKYMIALRGAALEGGKTSDSEMQRVTKISRMSMWEWKRDPAFVAWLIAAMRTSHDHDFELAMARHLRLAIQGSVRSFEAVARIRSIGQKGSGFPLGDEPPIGDRNYVINILVPRPTALSEGSS